MTEYRIDFQIMRRRNGEDDFIECAFGSTTAEDSMDQAAHMALSAIQNDEYDVTSPEKDSQHTEKVGSDG